MNTSVIVTARNVIVAPDEPVITDGGVVVRGDGRIGAVGSWRDLTHRYPAADILDFPSATMLPGLVNAHVHLAFDASSDPVGALRRSDASTLLATMVKNSALLLDEGVTTVRDLGDRDSLTARLRDLIRAGEVAGPRVLSAFAPLTTPGGHCFFLGGEVYDDASIRATVADHASRGAEVIKVMASGGRLTPGGVAMWEPQFTQRQINLVVAAAREVGLPVAAHAHGTECMAMCAQAGVDTIEHGSWRSGPEGTPHCYDPRDDVAEMIATAGTYICATRARNWPRWPERDELLGRLAWMRGHGVQLIAGTDAGVGHGLYDDLIELLTLYRAAGWSPREALATATTLAAGALGYANRIGRLRPGYEADLLIVAGDPLTDLEALRRVQCVIAAGRPYYPGSRARA